MRGVLLGCLEIIWQPGAMIAVLVAIRYFDATETSKSVLIASKFFGFLLTPLTLGLFARRRISRTRIMSHLFLATGALLILSSYVSSFVWFLIVTIFAQVVYVQYLPLNTELYAEHFTTDQRGHRISTIFIIAILFSGIGGLVVGKLLDQNLSLYRDVLRFAGASAMGCAFCLDRIPSEPLNESKVGSFRKNISLVRHDGLFAYMLGAWMLLGLGNLMVLPLRMEYMANPAFGVNASNETILLVMAVTPLTMKLLMTRILGKLFDQLNLITMRVCLNLLLLSSMIVFFSTKHLWMMALGMALMGTGMAGGRILWTLWVTKLAPEGKSSAYMSIHMMATGIRGVIAPFLGYALVRQFALMDIALMGSGLTLIATLLFLPARKSIHERTLANSTAAGL